MRYGVTGPSIRATGIPMDLRKDAPYLCYDEVKFDVPVGTHGDVFDRYLVRMAEMRESVKIILQCLDQIPGGDTANVIAKTAEVEAAKAAAKERGEDPKAVPGVDPDWLSVGQKINLLTYKPPAGEAYTVCESPRGMLGCHMISDGTAKAYRIKWRGASFSNLSALPELMIGKLYPDLMAIFGSLDVILPEVDR
jgi:NADH:ubiquinone oxidoreductase subunit D